MNSERINGPEINPIQQVYLPEVDLKRLSNEIPVYIVSGGSQNVIKLEIVIAAGRPYEHIKTSARTISSLLKEGTKTKTGEQIANELEFYGATFNTASDIDTTRVSLYCLSKYFKPAIFTIVDILKNAIFPQQELDLFKANMKQRLELDLMKNDVLAYRSLTESLFGKYHPYGYNSTIENYSSLDRETLVSEFSQTYGTNRCAMFLSGKINPEVLDILEEAFQDYTHKATRQRVNLNNTIPAKETLKLKSPNPYQSALRYGRRLFNKQHEDYAGISVLSTILGGYFGSRLMSNIREDKGYTYNIYSGLDSMIHDGYFYISTEVGKEYLEDTKVQIKHEIDVLKTELVTPSELQMVKNYMAGNYLNMLDGPLKSSRVIRNVISSDMELAAFDSIIAKTLSINSDEIRELANKYLDIEEMTEVVV